MTCEKCGRLNPQMASGRSSAKKLSDRLMVYEGYAPGNRQFTYKASPLCMVCREGGTPSQLKALPRAGEALRAWLVAVNERRD